MSAVNPKIISSLNNIRADFAALNPNDNETLIKVGAGLENLLTEFPVEISAVTDLFSLCLLALQKIFQEPEADFARLSLSIGAALVAGEHALLSPDNPIGETMIQQAEYILENELGLSHLEEPPEAEPIPAEVVETPQPMSFETVKAMLMQLEATDTKELSDLRDALKELANETEDVEKRKLLVKAARDLSKIVNGKAENPDEALTKIGELLERISEETPAAPKLKLVEPISATISSAVTEEIPEIIEFTAHQAEETLPPEADHSLLREFIIESRELIEASEAALLALENEPNDIEAINTVFRAFHTIKGTTAFIGLTKMTELAHLAESLLSRIRDGEIRCAGIYADLSLRGVDTLKEMLQSVENALQGEPLVTPQSYADLMEALANPEKAVNKFEPTIIPTVENAEIQESTNPAAIIQKTTAKSETSTDSSVRVRTDRLDSLIDIVGELVIAHSMLSQDDTLRDAGNHELLRKISHAGKIVRELQDLSMAMRMIPLKSTFQKIARLVRDVSQKCGKQVEFIAEGEDTEIDRNMVDVVADPLVHLVRNAVDHGIESPDVRAIFNKDRTGKVRIAAYHAGGDVVIELQDDGAGLNRDKIVEKAIAKGLIESEQGLSENEIYNLIFAPGFSTAEQVTDVSGRGVGMDVVRRNIEAMRGRIEISSERGKGSLFTVRLPLTLAITDGMLVKVGADRYIIPTVNIHLSFRPSRNQMTTVTGRGEMVSLRGDLIPVFRLHKLFDVENAVTNPFEGLLVVVADGKRRCALLVDELLGQQQMVVKSLGRGLGKIQGISGGAILGDGRVGLILDSAEIIALIRQSSSSADRKENRPQLKAA